jgi:uncharacterized repeat protein (TIGR01451 family)
MRGIGRLLSLLLLLALFAPEAARANTCAPAAAGGTAAADWRSYCWLDFTGYSDAQARSVSGQPFSFTLSDGSILQLTVRATSSASTALSAVAAPSWSGAAVGNTAFTGIPGLPILYTRNNASTVTLTLDSISVTAPSGLATNSSYAIIAADAESTNNGESLAFTTNGGPWSTVSQVPPISGSIWPTLSGAGTATVTETGVAGTVGGYVFGTTTPTRVTGTLVAGGLQGAMFAVRYAWVSVAKTLVSTRIAPADQFTYGVSATQNGAQLATATTSGAASGTYPAALITVSSGYPVSVRETMAGGSTSALASYVPSLTCSNATAGSPTVLPSAEAVTSFNLGTLAYGDAITCLFTNTALPRLTLSKALAGNRVFAGDQFALAISGGSGVLATATTTGTGSTLGTSATPQALVPAGAPYAFSESAAGTTVLAYYTASMACSNAFAGSSTTLPAAPGGSVTPKPGDDIRCTLTNTPKPAAVTLSIAKTTTAVSDPLNGSTSPKRLPGGRSSYDITVTNTGTAPVDANSLVITDVIPANTAFVVTPASGTAVSFTDGTPASGLAFAYPANVSYSNQVGGGAPYNYTPVAGPDGTDSRVTGLRIAPTGTLSGATAAGQPSFRLSFQIAVK